MVLTRVMVVTVGLMTAIDILGAARAHGAGGARFRDDDERELKRGGLSIVRNSKERENEFHCFNDIFHSIINGIAAKFNTHVGEFFNVL